MRNLASITGLVLIALVGAVCPTSGGWAAENANLLLNPGAEQGKGDLPSVWFAAQVPADGLRMWRATECAHTGEASLAITNEHRYKEEVSNNWAQSLQTVPQGKIIQLQAYLRTQGADAANVCVQCWDVAGKNLLAFQSTPVFRGDTDWTCVRSSPLVVPPETASIIVRAALTGLGTAWFDDLSLTIVDAPGGPVAPATEARPATSFDDDLTKAVPGKIIQAVAVTKDCMVLSYLP